MQSRPTILHYALLTYFFVRRTLCSLGLGAGTHTLTLFAVDLSAEPDPVTANAAAPLRVPILSQSSAVSFEVV